MTTASSDAREVNPAPLQMLREAAQDAIDGFAVLRVGMKEVPSAIELIDAHIDELRYALAAVTRSEG